MTEFYELSKGDLFRLPGDTKVWKCAGVDGMYARVVEPNESTTNPRNYRYGISPSQEVIKVDSINGASSE